MIDLIIYSSNLFLNKVLIYFNKSELTFFYLNIGRNIGNGLGMNWLLMKCLLFLILSPSKQEDRKYIMLAILW